MASPSMQIFMEFDDWLKGVVQEDSGMDSSSPSGEVMPCSRPPPVTEKRLRPQQDQALRCPRCDSAHTKFCYYNNYSLSQPRYLCKTCRRYWTKGGTLRNVPVGGGCRKNKRSGAKKAADLLHPSASSSLKDATSSCLRQPFPPVRLPHPESVFTNTCRSIDFLECKYDPMLDNPMDGLELADAKFGAILSGNHLPWGGGHPGLGDAASHGSASASFHSIIGTCGFSTDGNHAGLVEACLGLALPFEGHEEAKPGDRINLPTQWADQCCVDAGRAVRGCSNGLASWAGLMNGMAPR